jgi:hypothetical protein
MADRLNVTELDFDSIKTNLKNFLKQQSEFQDYDFDGSGLSVLLDVLSYNTHYNAYYLNAIANESFLESASLRESVVSHAKRLGYTPRSSRAARARVNITVIANDNLPETLVIPKGYEFLSSSFDGVAYKFVTLDAYTATKVNSQFVFNNVDIYEGELIQYSVQNSYSSNPNQIFEVPDVNVDTSKLSVLVRDTPSSSNYEVYTVAVNALNISSSSKVFYLNETKESTYNIQFGDNVLSKKIPDGSVVIMTYLSTSGSSANKANNFVSTSPIGAYSSLIVNSVSVASGGSDKETVDEIKRAAPLSLLSQNRAVTKNDYIRLIQQNYPALEAVNVWGGEDNEPPIYGKVFVSAKPKLGFELTDTEKDFIKQNILKPISILTVTPEIINVDYNYLKIQTNVFYDKAKTILSESEIKQGIKTNIVNFCNQNLNQFNSYFKYSNLETLIDSFNSSIISNEVELFVGKKFRPDLTTSNSYVLDFGFELNRGSTNDNFYSSPSFTMIDEDGVQRECFFEEIPSSFTGLESVIINNPGYGYTRTPTVNIIGDGTGAKAYADITNGKLEAIIVTDPGIGYTTAAIQIINHPDDTTGNLAKGTAVLQGRYGKIRIFYFKTDSISGQSTKAILRSRENEGVIGQIDYFLGKITINDFNPIAVSNDFGDLMINIKPKINIIQSKRNKMLVLDSDDPSSITVNTIQIE